MVGISYPAKGYRKIGGPRPFSTIEVYYDLENREDGQPSPSSYTINTYLPSVESTSPNMRFAPSNYFRKNQNRPFWTSSSTVLPTNAADEERLLAHTSEQEASEERKERKPGTGRSDNRRNGNNIKIIITEPEPVASRHGISLEFDPLRSHPVNLDRGPSIIQSGTYQNLTTNPRNAESNKTASNRIHQLDSGPRTLGPSSASRSHRHQHLRKSRRPTLGSVSGREDLRAVFQNGECKRFLVFPIPLFNNPFLPIHPFILIPILQNSIRRAALRSALSASRAISTQAPAASFSASIARTALVSSRIQAIRFFSQSPRVLNTEEPTQPEQTETETETAPAATEEAAVQKDTTEGHAAFVRNIVFDATEEHLKGAFEKFGNVTDVFLARDPRGLSKGYGFVTFATREALEEACSQVDGSFWHGRRISVEPRRAKVNRGSAIGEPSACLFIGNIPYETTDAELNNIFVGIDGLKDVRVAVDRATGWPRGFAHADFVDVEAAVKALEKLQGTQLGERTIKIDYAQPAAARQPRENNGERREYRPRQQRDGQRDGQRSYNRDGGNRSYNREGGNRNYNRDGGNRSYNREGGDRNYNRRDQGESTEF
ncbi:hypothetical protein B0T13DRAFT_489372 [Neurospora crassa]|nr:hypothetical protein B0T13DRAFT_489372 [Neurospora crassa]